MDKSIFESPSNRCHDCVCLNISRRICLFISNALKSPCHWSPSWVEKNKAGQIVTTHACSASNKRLPSLHATEWRHISLRVS
jgi:hypothetical protein